MIDLRFRRPSDIIEVETWGYLYDIKVVNPATGEVIVASTEPRFKEDKRCQFVSSVSSQNERMHQIIKNWSFLLRFADCAFVSDPVASASVRGLGWEYKVF